MVEVSNELIYKLMLEMQAEQGVIRTEQELMSRKIGTIADGMVFIRKRLDGIDHRLDSLDARMDAMNKDMHLVTLAVDDHAHPLWCMNNLPAASVHPGRVSSDSNTGRHADTRHPIEHVASNLCLDPLIAQSPGLKSPINDDLVPIDRSFDQAPTIVARTARPAHASMLSIVAICRSRCVVVISLGTAVARGGMMTSASGWRSTTAS